MGTLIGIIVWTVVALAFVLVVLVMLALIILVAGAIV